MATNDTSATFGNNTRRPQTTLVRARSLPGKLASSPGKPSNDKIARARSLPGKLAKSPWLHANDPKRPSNGTCATSGKLASSPGKPSNDTSAISGNNTKRLQTVLACARSLSGKLASSPWLHTNNPKTTPNGTSACKIALWQTSQQPVATLKRPQNVPPSPLARCAAPLSGLCDLARVRVVASIGAVCRL